MTHVLNTFSICNVYSENIIFAASKWEEPEEGFLSLAEQEKLKKKDKQQNKKPEEKDKQQNKKPEEKDKQQNKKPEESKGKKKEKSTTLSAPSVVYGPIKKAEAYSSWEQVKT